MKRLTLRFLLYVAMGLLSTFIVWSTLGVLFAVTPVVFMALLLIQFDAYEMGYYDKLYLKLFSNSAELENNSSESAK